MTEATARLKPLKGDASRIFKLCLDKDPKTALQGLELAASLGTLLEGVLGDVSVDAEGKLIRGKRFTAKDKTQAILDVLLLQQLALAPKGSPEAKLRNAITKLECEASRVPDLSMFTSLSTLKITFSSGFIGEDLTELGSLPHLKSLTLTTAAEQPGEQRGTLKSLSGLNAPQIVDLQATLLDLVDIAALSKCRQLAQVDLRLNKRLASIDGLRSSAATLERLTVGACVALSSLQPLRQATRLRSLDISSVDHLTDLSDLKDLISLESIELSGCKGLTSLKGIPANVKLRNVQRWTHQPAHALILDDLRSITSLKHFPPLASDITELRLNRASALSDLANLKACTGSLRVLHLDRVAITHLDALTALTHLESLEITQCPELVDATALATLEKLATVRITGCTKLERLPDTWKAPVRTLALTGCPALKPLAALPPGIDAKTIEIEDRKLLPRVKSVKALKSDASNVWKLLSSREIPSILSGLELSMGLEAHDFDALVEGNTVNDGALVRSKRFTGSSMAQPYLDLALFGLMSRARADSAFSQLRKQITELHLLFCSRAPQLEGLTNLTRLFIDLDESITPDLSTFGPMPRLETLEIGGKRWNSEGKLTSLKGLQAPALRHLKVSSRTLEDLSALRHSPQITTLNLSFNSTLSDLSGLDACAPNLIELNLCGCKQVRSLEVLTTATRLKSLNIYACESLESVQPLASCVSLEILNLEQCTRLSSLEAVAHLVKRTS